MVHLMPLTVSSVVRRMIQYITRLKSPVDIMPDTSFEFLQDVTITNTAGNVAKEASSDLKNVNWDSVDS